MRSRFFVNLLILPGTVLILVPVAILWAKGGSPLPLSRPIWAVWASGLSALFGGALMARTTSLFWSARGGGTIAPWAPIQEFVVHGPYRYMRNPMITGVALILLAEALFFWSGWIALWLGVFLALNQAHFILWEEPDLERRFGASYRAYRAAVPRWRPRLQAYVPPEEKPGADR